VAELQPAEAGNALLARADGALYLAKQQGRNRVMAARPAAADTDSGPLSSGAGVHDRHSSAAPQPTAPAQANP
ncbi:MAG: hypothetical protein Q8M96_02835, partial [Rubrivivax sp.]|nr:hypothetical protein [Rubrivivax sp.]